MNEAKENAWNYIAILDLTLNTSRIDIYKYEDKLSSPLPQLISEQPKHLDYGILDPNKTQDALIPLIDHALSVIPQERQKQTPLYIYGSASFREIPDKTRLQMITESCKFSKKNSTFAVADCSSLNSYLKGDREAILSWTAGMYTHHLDQLQTWNSTETMVDYAMLDLSPFNLHMAYTNKAESSKSDLVRLGLKTYDNSTKTLNSVFVDLNVLEISVFKTLKPEDISHCIPAGKNISNIAGIGNYTECDRVVKSLLLPFDESISSLNETSIQFGLTGGFDSWYGALQENTDNIRKVCETPEESAANTTDCINAVLASNIVLSLQNHNFTVYQAPSNWTQGRSLLHSDIDLASKLRDANNIGIRENVGSKIWIFGIFDNHVQRSVLSNIPTSHLHIGGFIVFLAILGLIWFLLGHRARSLVMSTITCARWRRRARWEKLSTEDNYAVELDEVEEFGNGDDHALDGEHRGDDEEFDIDPN